MFREGVFIFLVFFFQGSLLFHVSSNLHLATLFHMVDGKENFKNKALILKIPIIPTEPLIMKTFAYEDEVHETSHHYSLFFGN